MKLPGLFVIFIIIVSFINPLRAQLIVEQEEVISYTPQVFGAVKAKFETSLYDGQHRFNVRNSRIGVRGLVSEHMKYAIQIDFSNEGKLGVLDSYAAYFRGGLTVTLGQQSYVFSSDLGRGPTDNLFANRTILAKFLTTYYGNKIEDGQAVDYEGSLGGRDIGLRVQYRFENVPLELSGGIFNGAGINNPEWSNNLNAVIKIAVGAEYGLGAAVSHYNGKTPEMSHVVDAGGVPETVMSQSQIRMWGGELRYHGEDFKIMAEYAQRRLKNSGLDILSAAYISGYYRFRTKPGSEIAYIAPLARWDIGDGIGIVNSLTRQLECLDMQRVTLGVNFGLTGKIIASELRINAEKYFLNDKPGDFGSNPVLQDKITLEIIATF